MKTTFDSPCCSIMVNEDQSRQVLHYIAPKRITVDVWEKNGAGFAAFGLVCQPSLEPKEGFGR